MLLVCACIYAVNVEQSSHHQGMNRSVFPTQALSSIPVVEERHGAVSELPVHMSGVFEQLRFKSMWLYPRKGWCWDEPQELTLGYGWEEPDSPM